MKENKFGVKRTMNLENLNVKSGVHTVAKVKNLIIDHQKKMRSTKRQKAVEKVSQTQQGIQKVIYSKYLHCSFIIL